MPIGGYFFCGNDEVAFVLAVFIVDHDHHFSGTYVGNSICYGVKLDFLLHHLRVH